MDNIRLQVFLAKAGVASRRKSEELIKEGRVTVNGVRVYDMGVKVSYTDVILVNGKKVQLEQRKIYIALNKPEGYISSANDQFNRPTVLDLVKDIKERVYPVGRLDYDTSGLIILTNDGDFMYKLTHPKHSIQKTYIAKAYGKLAREDIDKFKSGILIDGYVTKPAKIKIISQDEKYTIAQVVIWEGRNRQIKKMFDAIDHPLISLQRISIGNVQLGDLEKGKWRYLNKQEIGCFNK